MEENPSNRKGARHIDAREHFVADDNSSKSVSSSWCCASKTNKMVADALTRNLLHTTHRQRDRARARAPRGGVNRVKFVISETGLRLKLLIPPPRRGRGREREKERECVCVRERQRRETEERERQKREREREREGERRFFDNQEATEGQ
jgi:hypothetical protein